MTGFLFAVIWGASGAIIGIVLDNLLNHQNKKDKTEHEKCAQTIARAYREAERDKEDFRKALLATLPTEHYDIASRLSEGEQPTKILASMTPAMRERFERWMKQKGPHENLPSINERPRQKRTRR